MIVTINKKVEDIKIPINLSKSRHHLWAIKRRFR